MKNQVSQAYRAITFFYLGFPVLFVAFSVTLFDIPGRDIGDILFSPLYYVLSGLAVLVGTGLYHVRRWAWHAFAALHILIFYYCISINVRLGETHHPVTTLVIAFAIFGFFLFTVAKELRVPYILPRIQWWESHIQDQLKVPVKITRSDGSSLLGNLLDLSEKGCFIKLSDRLEEGEEIDVYFGMFGQSLDAKGEVVFRSHSTVTLPNGVGIRFQPMLRKKKRRFRIASKRLKAILSLGSDSRRIPDRKEFYNNIEKIQYAIPASDLRNESAQTKSS